MKKTLLLVEDSKVQKLATGRVLLGAGYLVLYACDGEEALRLARESLPDLVLLDLLLPGIGGEEVLCTLKRDPHTEPIPVIVISHLPPTNAATLKAAGAVDYIQKSRLQEDDESENTLLDTIDRVLRASDGRNGAARRLPLAVRH